MKDLLAVLPLSDSQRNTVLECANASDLVGIDDLAERFGLPEQAGRALSQLCRIAGDGDVPRPRA